MKGVEVAVEACVELRDGSSHLHTLHPGRGFSIMIVLL